MSASTLPGLLAGTAALHGDRTAFVAADAPSATWAEVARRAAGVSGALAALNCPAGEPVGLLAPNRPEWGIAFFGILGAGAPVAPLDPHLTPAELAHLLAEFGMRRVLADRALRPALEGTGVEILPLEPEGPAGPAPGPRPGDLAVLLASSGTTGKPKGVMLSHANLLANLEQFRRAIPFGPEDAFLGLLPFHHVFPLLGSLLAAAGSGGRVVIPEGPRPAAVLKGMREGGVSFGLLVPGLLRLVAKAAEREGGREAFGPALRSLVVGGAPCPVSTLEALAALSVPVLQGYGMSEASPVIALNTFEANRTGTVGRPVPGVEVRIDGSPEGEILVRGPNVMMGYFRDPERTAETLRDGWLHTGDVGVLDAEGFLSIKGRAKRVIISASGKNVYPEEIEAELLKSERIRECCVVGLAEDGDEKVVAVVVPAEGQDAETVRADILARGRALADYKRVREVVIRSEGLPKTASGKVKSAAVEAALKEARG